MYLEIYRLDPAHFLFAPRLARQAALKKIKVKLDQLADIDMLLMVEKDIKVLFKSIYSVKFLKTLYKNISESISCNIPDFFTRRALKRNLGTPRSLQGHLGTRALRHSRHLST